MILIADSGSTKTDWVIVEEGETKARFTTQGINPVHQDTATIAGILRNELLPALTSYSSSLTSHLTSVFFYGSGCIPSLQPAIERQLRESLPDADTVEVAGDLLGAARALCGSNEGIACILGTGANSCLYDGRQIIANTPPLGYVLGDEGSGAVLGIRFLNAVLKGLLPERLKTELLDWLQMTEADIIGRIYRQPLANRWLASLSLFIATHIDETDVRALVTDNFRQFFRRNVVQYGRRDLPVCFVGSIAHYYREQLGEAAAAEGFTLGRVEKSPVDGLTAYHAG